MYFSVQILAEEAHSLDAFDAKAALFTFSIIDGISYKPDP